MKFRISLLLVVFSLVLAASVSVQAQIQPPTGPVTFCGTQAAPAADSYTVTVDGGTPQSLTTTAPVAACPAGSTHSFTLPAALFSVGTHQVVVRATNTFGATTGPAYQVIVGIAPGRFTVTAVIPPGA